MDYEFLKVSYDPRVSELFSETFPNSPGTLESSVSVLETYLWENKFYVFVHVISCLMVVSV